MKDGFDFDWQIFFLVGRAEAVPIDGVLDDDIENGSGLGSIIVEVLPVDFFDFLRGEGGVFGEGGEVGVLLAVVAKVVVGGRGRESVEDHDREVLDVKTEGSSNHL